MRTLRLAGLLALGAMLLGAQGFGWFINHKTINLERELPAAVQLPGNSDKIYQMVEERIAQDATAKHWKQHPVLSASDEQSVIVLGTPPLGPAAWIESPPSFFLEALAMR